MKPQPRAAVKRKYRLRADLDARRKRKDKRFLSSAATVIQILELLYVCAGTDWITQVNDQTWSVNLDNPTDDMVDEG